MPYAGPPTVTEHLRRDGLRSTAGILSPSHCARPPVRSAICNHSLILHASAMLPNPEGPSEYTDLHAVFPRFQLWGPHRNRRTYRTRPSDPTRVFSTRDTRATSRPTNAPWSRAPPTPGTYLLASRRKVATVSESALRKHKEKAKRKGGEAIQGTAITAQC